MLFDPVPLFVLIRRCLEATKKLKKCIDFIYSQLSRCSTARGSSTGLSLVGPTKVKVRKSFLLAEVPIKLKNKDHLLDFVVTV